jgi:hypothetical protein
MNTGALAIAVLRVLAPRARALRQGWRATVLPGFGRVSAKLLGDCILVAGANSPIGHEVERNYITITWRC